MVYTYVSALMNKNQCYSCTCIVSSELWMVAGNFFTKSLMLQLVSKEYAADLLTNHPTNLFVNEWWNQQLIGCYYYVLNGDLWLGLCSQLLKGWTIAFGKVVGTHGTPSALWGSCACQARSCHWPISWEHQAVWRVRNMISISHWFCMVMGSTKHMYHLENVVVLKSWWSHFGTFTYRSES